MTRQCATKRDKFLIKSFYDEIVQRGLKSFWNNAYLESLGSNKSEFFHLGSNLERDSN